MQNAHSPTPYPAINAVLRDLQAGVQAVLGQHLVGMYLEGSLANGDFDESSDIDFVVATDVYLGAARHRDRFAALYDLHAHIAEGPSPWVIQLEGSYLSLPALRRYDPAEAMHPNLERGVGERLKVVRHDEAWATHRLILRERGITLVGPAPQTLLDPVTPADLRLGMTVVLRDWAAPMLKAPAQLDSPGYQAYTVLSLCRVLYTLHFGTVVSKRVAAHWARETLGEPWTALIDQAWQTRQTGQWPAQVEAQKMVLAFIRYGLAQSQIETRG